MLSPRSRFVPLAIALPLMLGLWLTIGLPIFAELSGAAGGNDAMRDFLFDAGASGATGGNGGDRGPSSPGFVAAAIVDPKVVRQVRLERLLSRTAANVTPRVRTTPPPRAAGVEPAVDAALSELGSIRAIRDWASSAEFTGSQMSLSGNTITVVLDTLSGTITRDPSAKALVWTTPYGTATESGHADSNF